VIHESKITDYAWLKLNGKYITQDRYRRYTAKGYNKFDIDQFVELVENELPYNRDMDVSEKAMRLVDNMVQALNVITTKK